MNSNPSRQHRIRGTRGTLAMLAVLLLTANTGAIAYPIDFLGHIAATARDPDGGTVDQSRVEFAWPNADGSQNVSLQLDTEPNDPTDPFGALNEARGFANDAGEFGAWVHVDSERGDISGSYRATYLKDSADARHQVRFSNTFLSLVDFGAQTDDFLFARLEVEVLAQTPRLGVFASLTDTVQILGRDRDFEIEEGRHLTGSIDHLLSGFDLGSAVLNYRIDNATFNFLLDPILVGEEYTAIIDYELTVGAAGGETFAHAQFWDPNSGGGLLSLQVPGGPVPDPGPNPVPAPGTAALLAAASGALWWRRRQGSLKAPGRAASCPG
ncbi:MAG: PEP-CTERM sorting domain-containing protein [Rhodocyclaceae bacterium]|nr:PEP-CTERM sorting domain-containing protein [Rhodocyclaceae bacterium]